MKQKNINTGNTHGHKFKDFWLQSYLHVTRVGPLIGWREVSGKIQECSGA
jgi:hypothetical protein